MMEVGEERIINVLIVLNIITVIQEKVQRQKGRGWNKRWFFLREDVLLYSKLQVHSYWIFFNINLNPYLSRKVAF